jgi:hypothetical protein
MSPNEHKEAHRLLSHLTKKGNIKVRNYYSGAKSNHFKINIYINNSRADKRVVLFKKLLVLFAKSINQVDKFVKKKTIDRFYSCLATTPASDGTSIFNERTKGN